MGVLVNEVFPVDIIISPRNALAKRVSPGKFWNDGRNFLPLWGVSSGMKTKEASKYVFQRSSKRESLAIN